ncbi:MAG: hypothetical protein WBC29_02305 [Candidatus Moraniibacteriota bacterium]
MKNFVAGLFFLSVTVLTAAILETVFPTTGREVLHLGFIEIQVGSAIIWVMQEGARTLRGYARAWMFGYFFAMTVFVAASFF